MRLPLFALLVTSVFASFVLAACQPDVAFSGNELMGTFAFRADLSHPTRFPDGGTPLINGIPACDFSEVRDGGFDFDGTFSRFKDTSEAFFKVNGNSRNATFDGQTLTSTQRAPRRFERIGCPPDWQVDETLQVVLLSESQSRALQDNCETYFADPSALLVDPDAGIVGPGSTPEGFDAIRACGSLQELAFPSTPDGKPLACAEADGGVADGGGLVAAGECVLVYRVTGVRRQ